MVANFLVHKGERQTSFLFNVPSHIHIILFPENFTERIVDSQMIQFCCLLSISSDPVLSSCYFVLHLCIFPVNCCSSFIYPVMNGNANRGSVHSGSGLRWYICILFLNQDHNNMLYPFTSVLQKQAQQKP